MSVIVWFEIPVNNMSRAKKFYEKILKIQMPSQKMCDAEMAFFPSKEKKYQWCSCKAQRL